MKNIVDSFFPYQMGWITPKKLFHATVPLNTNVLHEYGKDYFLYSVEWCVKRENICLFHNYVWLIPDYLTYWFHWGTVVQDTVLYFATSAGKGGGRDGVVKSFSQVQFLSTHELRNETTTKNARRKPEKILFMEVFVLVMWFFFIIFWKAKIF
jgi:hypothetical protein